MKRLSIATALLAAGVLFVHTAPRAAVIHDIPENHWSFHETSQLVDKGYLSLFEDGTFRGETPLSRYAFVAALSKVVAEVDRLKAAKPGAAGGGADTTELKSLLAQVKTALGQLETAQQQLGTKAQKTGETQEVLEKDLTQLVDTTRQSLKDMAQQLADMDDASKNRDQRLQADIAQLNEDLRKANKKNANARTLMWIGIVGAAAAGVASN